MNRYELDTQHTDLGFTAKHMVFTTVRGRFNEYDGYVEVDGDHFTDAKGEFTLQVASIDSANEKRDEHLRSADFFNAAEYPVLTFRPTSVAAKGDDHYAVIGDLTIRDVTKPIELDAKVEGRIPRDAFGKERIAVSATGTLNRKDWGLNWNMALETGGFLVSEEIKIVVEAAFVADARVTAGAAA